MFLAFLALTLIILAAALFDPVRRTGGGAVALECDQRKDYGELLVLREGDEIELTFPSLPINAVSAELLAEGYYIPH